jgi:hypothetical protein
MTGVGGRSFCVADATAVTSTALMVAMTPHERHGATPQNVSTGRSRRRSGKRLRGRAGGAPSSEK